MTNGRLRLCFLTRDYALQPPYGGVATYVRDAARWLAAQGHDIEVVCVNRKHVPHTTEDGRVNVHFVSPKRIKPRRLVGLAARLPGLDSLREAYSGWGLLENSLGGWSTVRLLSRAARFDLIECDDYEGLAFWGLWPIHRYRVLLRGHGIIHLDLPFARYPGARFHHFLERLCADRADFILTASENLVGCYRAELGLRHNRIASLALPLDVRDMPQRDGDDIRTDGQVTVLYVGRLEHRKGTDLLFAALPLVRQQFAGVRCVLVGATEDEFTEQLASFLASNAGWVTYAGALPQDQVFVYMARADILAFPSRTETLPRTLIEAQLLGLPQVATRVGGIPEVVEDGVTGLLIDSDDAEALADAIAKLCLDQGLRTRMAEASRARAPRKYDIDTIMAQQLALYQTLANGSTPAGAFGNARNLIA